MEETISPDSPDINSVCGDPQVDPRVGDEYQVEVPPMISDYAEFLSGVVASEVRVDSSHSFLMALPIPIMWINNGDDFQGLPEDKVDINESLKSIKAKRSRFCTKNRISLHKTLDQGFEDKKISKTVNVEQIVKGRTANYLPVPGLLSSSWEDAEVDCFLLGLYTFGKNFIQVEKFIESKDMGDILSFYYGRFYKSSKYRRWSDSRKKRSRKCVYGRKLFSGWRQHELLSRLLTGVSEELQKNRLLNVSKSFAEGNLSLERYICSLKAIVGTNALVDAIAIGKGKEDLTNLAMEPVKTKQWFTVSSNLPAAKAYASLTSCDIIKHLTGGSRLSKARCNDIFWEAVWPRLLARGWHSEQPKNRGYVTSKDYLVFLVPGVKKFSRRKLVKGDHYFDSVSDILTKVASQPELLEFEAGEIKASSFNPSNQDVPSDRQSLHYLRSPVFNHNSLHMKFTIVDTSSAIEGKLCSLRELNFAATDSKITSESTIRLENDGSVLKDSTNKPKLEKACDMPLDDEKSTKDADDGRGETGRFISDNAMTFTIVDTSLECGGKSSGLREQRFLPIDFKPRINSSSTKNDRISSDGSSDEHEQTRALNTKPDSVESEKISKPSKGTLDTEGPCDEGLDSCTTEKMLEKDRDQEIDVLDDGKSKKVIKHKRRAETNRSVTTGPLLKRRRLSACVKTEISRLTESSLVKPDLNQTRPHCPLNTHDARTQVHSQENTSKEAAKSDGLSFKDNAKEESSGSNHKGDSFGMEMDENSEKHQTQFSIDLNKTPNHTQDYESGQTSPVEGQDTQGLNPNGYCSMFDMDKLDSKGLGTTNDVGSADQQPDLNIIPRRQSTRKRPLTTRVLEALEAGFFTTKKPKSTKLRNPRKQESPLKRHATRTRGKVRVSDHSNVEPGILNKEVKNGSERSFLVKEGMISKPVDQIEKGDLTGEPKRPPILLKLSFKRN